ncbi:MAG: transcription antitermination factor NusB [Treponema sp.]|jgi:N utilization substance protein B|nr:transcription antitermination factor NusB [Treponema sp.]
MASRRKGRILAFQALYCWEATHPPVADLVTFPWLGTEKLAAFDDGIGAFARLLIAGTIENIKAIDEMIKQHLQHWDIERLGRVDLAILRMSVYALMYQNEIAPSIVIDEAIGISREFGTDDSFRFVNGVLDNIRKTLQARHEQKI